ncbi:MAG: cation:proton antiporter, partial [Ignavibacteria bacterium]|nr:cation:proton antiporter [Ignavibacteria bacterium]
MSLLRKLSVLVLTFLIIVGIKIFLPQGYSDFGSDSIIALGFILIAAFSFGELVKLLGFPKIVGYLIAGIVFGPFSNVLFKTNFLNIFADSSLNDLKFLNELAFGLIAFIVGCEIHFMDLKEQKRTIFNLIVFKILFVSIPIAILILIIFPFVGIFTSVNFATLILISLLLGVLLISTSPAATIAVMNEFGDKSKLSKLVLNTSVIKEIIIIFLLAFVLGYSKLILYKSYVFDFYTILLGLYEVILSILVGVL